MALDEGWISSKGRFVQEFENLFADFVGAKYAIATNTGTAACHLALLATKREHVPMHVMVPNLTFVATANAVTYCREQLLLSEVKADTWNLGKNIDHNTQATHIFAVHLFGNPCDVPLLKKIYPHAIIVEDACEAHGSSLNGKMAGTLGDIAAFSFFGNKTITTGEGGMVTTNDRYYYEQALHLKGQAQTTQYAHDAVGHNYRMTNIQAAIGVAQMEKIEDILLAKDNIHQLYSHYLQDTGLCQQKITDNAISNHWMNVVILDGLNVLDIQECLSRRGIDTRIMFQPISSFPMYRNHKSYQHSEHIAQYGIMLPSYPTLNVQQVKHICETIKDYIK